MTLRDVSSPAFKYVMDFFYYQEYGSDRKTPKVHRLSPSGVPSLDSGNAIDDNSSETSNLPLAYIDTHPFSTHATVSVLRFLSKRK
jgi:hypothetical protein